MEFGDLVEPDEANKFVGCAGFIGFVELSGKENLMLPLSVGF